ncbi:MAG: SDR family NAD(P)-dependent oxidoreductase [Ignavibacteriota bacterium]
MRAAEERVGPIDILVNNAGIARVQPVEEITERDWDDLIDGNLKSCFLMTQAVLPVCARTSGGASSISLRWRRRWAAWSALTMPRRRRVCTGLRISMRSDSPRKGSR